MIDNFVKIFRLLLPFGRAWNILLSNFFQKVVRGIMLTAERISIYFVAIKNDVFPNTTRDIALWEEQFALPTADGLTEQERRDRIAARWSAQGGQSPTYIEDVLASLGIIAKVYENFNLYPNRFGSGRTFGDGGTFSNGTAIDPRSFLYKNAVRFGQGRRFGDGCTFMDPEDNFDDVILVNGFIPGKTYTVSDDPEKWVFYFFIADPSDINVPVYIPKALKSAFITTLLQIKPTHTRAVLNVVYID